MRKRRGSKVRRSLKARNALVEQFRYLPKRVVLDIIRRYPFLEVNVERLTMEDLEQTGMIPLINAAAMWDKSRGIKFITYAYIAVHRYLLDHIQVNSSVIRLAKWNPGAAQFMEQRINAQEVGPMVGAIADGLLDKSEDPKNEVIRRDLVAKVRRHVKRLSNRVRCILAGRLVREERLDVLGKRLGISKQRVQQIYTETIARLRERCAHLAA